MTAAHVEPRDRLPVELGGRAWSIELRRLRRRPVPTFRSGMDSGTEPGEQSLSNETIWRRTARDWVLGAGQDHFDEEDESTRRRFARSKGVNPWGRRNVTLLGDTELLAGSAATTQRLAATDTRLWWSHGSTLAYSADPAAGFSTVDNTGSADITSLAYTGTHLYLANGQALRRVALDGDTASVFGDTTPHLVAFASGRLLGADKHSLFEIDSNGEAVPIWDYPNSGFRWDWILGTLNGIYVGGSAAGRSEVFLVSVVDATGELAPPYPVMPFVADETIHCATYYAGYVIFGTDRGVRLARIQANGFLAYGPLRETAPVQAMASRGEFVWFSWPNFDTTSTGLGRLSLARFTDEMVPAFASDLMVDGAGAVEGIASWGDRRYFCVAGLGVVGETAGPVSQGWLESGQITFGTPERKAFVSIEGRWDPIPDGAEIDVEFISDSGLNHGGIRAARTGLGAVHRFDTGNAADRNTEGGQVLVTLRASPDGQAPTLHRWTLRAIPMPFQAEEIFVPLQLHQRVTDRGVVVHQATVEDYQFIVGLRDNRTLVPLKLGDEELLVYVNAILVDQDHLTTWNTERSFIEGTYYASCVSVGAEG